MAEIIATGKYSYVLKSKRVSNGRCVVAKLLSMRWVHVAVNEWYISQIIGEHPNILKAELDDVWLHSDKQQDVAKAILSAYRPSLRACCCKRVVHIADYR